MKQDWKIDLEEFLNLYDKGIYTHGEIIHGMVLFFDDLDEGSYNDFWCELPPFIKNGILSFLKDVDDDTCFILPAHSDGHEMMKRRYLSLRKWLIATSAISES